MDAGAVTGKRETVLWDEPVFEGGEYGGKAEDRLEPFFKMEREYIMIQGVSGHPAGNAGMLIGKFEKMIKKYADQCRLDGKPMPDKVHCHMVRNPN